MKFMEWIYSNYDVEIVFQKSNSNYFKKFLNLIKYPLLTIEHYFFSGSRKNNIHEKIKISIIPEQDIEHYFINNPIYKYIISFTSMNNLKPIDNCDIININAPLNYNFDSNYWERIISSVLLHFDYCKYWVIILNNSGPRIIEGDIPTKNSIIQLHINLLRKNLETIKDYLLGNANSEQTDFSSDSQFIYSRNYFDWFLYYKKIFYLFLLKIYFSKNGIINFWNVGYYFGKWNDFKFQNFKKFKIKNHSYVADPFLFSYRNKTYCFVEEYLFAKKKGVISYYSLDDNEFIYSDIIIEEEFHLSFPFIFEYENNIFLCPESTANKDIRLYRSVDFPTKWEFVTTIMQNVNAADSMLFYYSDLWWLFTNINSDFNSDNCSDFSIFYSKDLFSNNWISHLCNPISRSSLNARNGGYFISEKKIYRVNQQHGMGVYGKRFQINEIVKLSPNEYKEIHLKTIGKNEIGDIVGSHHFTSVNNINVFDFVYNKLNKII